MSENITSGDSPDTCKCRDCGHEFHERDVYEIQTDLKRLIKIAK
jgi:hypothetical protein